MTSKNILLPLSVMTQIVHLLYNLDISTYDVILQAEHDVILDFLTKKQRTLDLRNMYAALIKTQNPDDRHNARTEYFRHKYKF